MNTYSIRYFAHLREQRGCDEETCTSAAATPAQLYDELCAAHQLTMTRRSLVVAINDELARWDTALNHGDSVVFLPPVSGG